MYAHNLDTVSHVYFSILIKELYWIKFLNVDRTKSNFLVQLDLGMCK